MAKVSTPPVVEALARAVLAQSVNSTSDTHLTESAPTKTATAPTPAPSPNTAQGAMVGTAGLVA